MIALVNALATVGLLIVAVLAFLVV